MDVGASVLSVDAGGVGAVAASWIRNQDHVPYLLREVLFGVAPAGAKTKYSARSTNAQQFSRRNAQMAWGVRHHVVGDHADLQILQDAPQNIGMERYLSQLAQPVWDHDVAVRVRDRQGRAVAGRLRRDGAGVRRGIAAAGLRAPGFKPSGGFGTFDW